jgi:hypothetical protein
MSMILADLTGMLQIARENDVRGFFSTELLEQVVEELAGHDKRVTELLEANNREVERRRAAEHKMLAPIDLLLYCPRCDAQHIDMPDEATGWTNPPHRSHLCGQCGWVWRPADVATNGIAGVKSKGERDLSPIPVRDPDPASQDTTWFWLIVDQYGPIGLPSDEKTCLQVLVDHYRGEDGKAAPESHYIGLDRPAQVLAQPEEIGACEPVTEIRIGDTPIDIQTNGTVTVRTSTSGYVEAYPGGPLVICRDDSGNPVEREFTYSRKGLAFPFTMSPLD